MTEGDLEARARRAYLASFDTNETGDRWERLTERSRQRWLAIARAVLEEPPSDPFEEWNADYCRQTAFADKTAEADRRAAWDAATAHEREECAKIADVQADSCYVAELIRARGGKL